MDNPLYDRLAETWWRPGSPLGRLDTLNPGRFAYLDGVLDARGPGHPARRSVPAPRDSEQTFHRWKAKFGGMDVNKARRLK